MRPPGATKPARARRIAGFFVWDDWCAGCLPRSTETARDAPPQCKESELVCWSLPMLVRDQIRAAMLLRRMTVQQLARAAHVCNMTARHWLAGKASPTVAQARNLETALQVTLDVGKSVQCRVERVFTPHPELLELLQLEHQVHCAVSDVVREVELGGSRLPARIAVEALRRAVVAVQEQPTASARLARRPTGANP